MNNQLFALALLLCVVLTHTSHAADLTVDLSLTPASVPYSVPPGTYEQVTLTRSSNRNITVGTGVSCEGLDIPVPTVGGSLENVFLEIANVQISGANGLRLWTKGSLFGGGVKLSFVTVTRGGVAVGAMEYLGLRYSGSRPFFTAEKKATTTAVTAEMKDTTMALRRKTSQSSTRLDEVALTPRKSSQSLGDPSAEQKKKATTGAPNQTPQSSTALGDPLSAKPPSPAPKKSSPSLGQTSSAMRGMRGMKPAAVSVSEWGFHIDRCTVTSDNVRPPGSATYSAIVFLGQIRHAFGPISIERSTFHAVGLSLVSTIAVTAPMTSIHAGVFFRRNNVGATCGGALARGIHFDATISFTSAPTRPEFGSVPPGVVVTNNVVTVTAQARAAGILFQEVFSHLSSLYVMENSVTVTSQNTGAVGVSLFTIQDTPYVAFVGNRPIVKSTNGYDAAGVVFEEIIQSIGSFIVESTVANVTAVNAEGAGALLFRGRFKNIETVRVWTNTLFSSAQKGTSCIIFHSEISNVTDRFSVWGNAVVLRPIESLGQGTDTTQVFPAGVLTFQSPINDVSVVQIEALQITLDLTGSATIATVSGELQVLSFDATISVATVFVRNTAVRITRPAAHRVELARDDGLRPSLSIIGPLYATRLVVVQLRGFATAYLASNVTTTGSSSTRLPPTPLPAPSHLRPPTQITVLECGTAVQPIDVLVGSVDGSTVWSETSVNAPIRFSGISYVFTRSTGVSITTSFVRSARFNSVSDVDIVSIDENEFVPTSRLAGSDAHAMTSAGLRLTAMVHFPEQIQNVESIHITQNTMLSGPSVSNTLPPYTPPTPPVSSEDETALDFFVEAFFKNVAISSIPTHSTDDTLPMTARLEFGKRRSAAPDPTAAIRSGNVLRSWRLPAATVASFVRFDGLVSDCGCVTVSLNVANVTAPIASPFATIPIVTGVGFFEAIVRPRTVLFSGNIISASGDDSNSTVTVSSANSAYAVFLGGGIPTAASRFVPGDLRCHSFTMTDSALFAQGRSAAGFMTVGHRIACRFLDMTSLLVISSPFGKPSPSTPAPTPAMDVEGRSGGIVLSVDQIGTESGGTAPTVGGFSESEFTLTVRDVVVIAGENGRLDVSRGTKHDAVAVTMPKEIFETTVLLGPIFAAGHGFSLAQDDAQQWSVLGRTVVGDDRTRNRTVATTDVVLRARCFRKAVMSPTPSISTLSNEVVFTESYLASGSISTTPTLFPIFESVIPASDLPIDGAPIVTTGHRKMIWYPTIPCDGCLWRASCNDAVTVRTTRFDSDGTVAAAASATDATIVAWPTALSAVQCRCVCLRGNGVVTNQTALGLQCSSHDAIATAEAISGISPSSPIGYADIISAAVLRSALVCPTGPFSFTETRSLPLSDTASTSVSITQTLSALSATETKRSVSKSSVVSGTATKDQSNTSELSVTKSIELSKSQTMSMTAEATASIDVPVQVPTFVEGPAPRSLMSALFSSSSSSSNEDDPNVNPAANFHSALLQSLSDDIVSDTVIPLVSSAAVLLLSTSVLTNTAAVAVVAAVNPFLGMTLGRVMAVDGMTAVSREFLMRRRDAVRSTAASLPNPTSSSSTSTAARAFKKVSAASSPSTSSARTIKRVSESDMMSSASTKMKHVANVSARSWVATPLDHSAAAFAGERSRTRRAFATTAASTPPTRATEKTMALVAAVEGVRSGGATSTFVRYDPTFVFSYFPSFEIGSDEESYFRAATVFSVGAGLFIVLPLAFAVALDVGRWFKPGDICVVVAIENTSDDNDSDSSETNRGDDGVVFHSGGDFDSVASPSQDNPTVPLLVTGSTRSHRDRDREQRRGVRHSNQASRGPASTSQQKNEIVHLSELHDQDVDTLRRAHGEHHHGGEHDRHHGYYQSHYETEEEHAERLASNARSEVARLRQNFAASFRLPCSSGGGGASTTEGDGAHPRHTDGTARSQGESSSDPNSVPPAGGNGDGGRSRPPHVPSWTIRSVAASILCRALVGGFITKLMLLMPLLLHGLVAGAAAALTSTSNDAASGSSTVVSTETIYAAALTIGVVAGWFGVVLFFAVVVAPLIRTVSNDDKSTNSSSNNNSGSSATDNSNGGQPSGDSRSIWATVFLPACRWEIAAHRFVQDAGHTHDHDPIGLANDHTSSNLHTPPSSPVRDYQRENTQQEYRTSTYAAGTSTSPRYDGRGDDDQEVRGRRSSSPNGASMTHTYRSEVNTTSPDRSSANTSLPNHSMQNDGEVDDMGRAGHRESPPTRLHGNATEEDSAEDNVLDVSPSSRAPALRYASALSVLPLLSLLRHRSAVVAVVLLSLCGLLTVSLSISDGILRGTVDGGPMKDHGIFSTVAVALYMIVFVLLRPCGVLFDSIVLILIDLMLAVCTVSVTLDGSDFTTASDLLAEMQQARSAGANGGTTSRPVIPSDFDDFAISSKLIGSLVFVSYVLILVLSIVCFVRGWIVTCCFSHSSGLASDRQRNRNAGSRNRNRGGGSGDEEVEEGYAGGVGFGSRRAFEAHCDDEELTRIRDDGTADAAAIATAHLTSSATPTTATNVNAAVLSSFNNPSDLPTLPVKSDTTNHHRQGVDSGYDHHRQDIEQYDTNANDDDFAELEHRHDAGDHEEPSHGDGADGFAQYEYEEEGQMVPEETTTLLIDDDDL